MAGVCVLASSLNAPEILSFEIDCASRMSINTRRMTAQALGWYGCFECEPGSGAEREWDAAE